MLTVRQCLQMPDITKELRDELETIPRDYILLLSEDHEGRQTIHAAPPTEHNLSLVSHESGDWFSPCTR